MGRPSKKLHELIPVRKGTKAVVNYRGKSVYLGPWDIDRDEPTPAATQRLAELVTHWRADPGAVERTKPKDLLLVELWERWRRSPAGKGYGLKAARMAEIRLFGDAENPGGWLYHRASQFGSAELRAWQDHLCELTRPDGEKLYAQAVIMKAVGVVRQCFSWAVIERLVPWEQYRELELVPPPAPGQARPDGKRKGVSKEDVWAMLPYLSKTLQGFVQLMWYTCARPSELYSIRVGEVRKSGKVLSASGVVLDLAKLGVWCAVKEEHKTDDGGYDRVIFFGPKSQKILKPILATRGPEELVFRSDLESVMGKGHYSHVALIVTINRAVERHGLRRWVPYQIRHAVFRLVQARWGRDAARVFGGHQVGGVTERYAGADLHAAAKVAKSWG